MLLVLLVLGEKGVGCGQAIRRPAQEVVELLLLLSRQQQQLQL